MNVPVKENHTIVYGCSDDLVEIDGAVRGECGCYGTDDRDKGVLVILSDGTILEVKYGKGDSGIWAVTLLQKGSLFVSIDQCTDEDATPYSDVAHFEPGIKWAYFATGWEKA